MSFGGALSLAQPCHSHPFQKPQKRYVRLVFWPQLPIRGIIGSRISYEMEEKGQKGMNGEKLSLNKKKYRLWLFL